MTSYADGDDYCRKLRSDTVQIVNRDGIDVLSPREALFSVGDEVAVLA